MSHVNFSHIFTHRKLYIKFFQQQSSFFYEEFSSFWINKSWKRFCKVFFTFILRRPSSNAPNSVPVSTSCSHVDRAFHHVGWHSSPSKFFLNFFYPSAIFRKSFQRISTEMRERFAMKNLMIDSWWIVFFTIVLAREISFLYF